MAIKPGYLLLAGGGAIVLWSGVKGHKWTTTFRDLISGHQPAGGPELPISGTSPTGASNPGTGSGAPVGGTQAKNLAIGKVMTAAYGWSTGQQWSSLVALWMQESGWDNKARNPSSGAYGIPQALPDTKLPVLGRPPVSSASVQIGWGLGYIKQRYGDPVNAEAHEKEFNWY